MTVSIIIDENPISRCYLKILKDNNIKLDNLVYLVNKKFLPNFIKLRMEFNKNNYWPLRLLKKKEFKYFSHQVEDYFNYKRGFCEQMYNYENLNLVGKNILVTQSRNINSADNIKLISKMEEKIFINTGKQIFKDIFLSGKKFIHIHPGELPHTKGADASLWQYKNYKNFSASCFLMNKKIDEGELIFKKKFNFKKFKLNNFSNNDIKIIYRVWYSVFDPLLRGTILRELIQNNKINIKKFTKSFMHDGNEGQYHSFMNKKQLTEVFKSIFFSM